MKSRYVLAKAKFLMVNAMLVLMIMACNLSAFSSQAPATESASTSQGESHHSGPFKMGEPIPASDFSLVVDDFSVKSDKIYLTLVVQNVDSAKHVFRYQRGAISVKDDLGNVYKPEYLSTGLYEDVQVEIGPGEAVSFRSTFAGSGGSRVIARYVGVIPSEASKLIIDFKGFGPYEDVSVEIDL